MRIKALIVAPYQGLAELTTTLKDELRDFDISIVSGDLSEALSYLDQIQSEDYEVLISRGGTARLLREHSSIPVIDIQVSGFDLLRILMLVKDYQSKMIMVGFPNVIEGFVSVSGLLDVHIPYTSIHSEDEVDEVVRKAKTDGIKFIVGDTITVKRANEYGIQGVLITSGRESVLEAFAQARQIYKLSARYKRKERNYEALLDTMSSGYAIIDQRNNIHYANPSFYQLFHLPEDVDQLNTPYPQLQYLINNLNLGIALDHLITVNSYQTLIAAGGDIEGVDDQISLIPHEHNKKLHYLKVISREAVQSEITVRYMDKQDESLPQWMITGEELFDAGQSDYSYPLAIYGERGVGKRMMAMKLLSAGQRSEFFECVEVRIEQPSQKSMEALITLITTSKLAITIFGAEKLPLLDQQRMLVAIQQYSYPVIFLFERSPADLRKEHKIDSKLYESIKHQIVRIPSLGDRLQQLDEFIRSFLIMSNERYGKQIVGLRPTVREALHAHPWKGNLLELKEVIDQFVMHTDGEFVKEDAIALLLHEKVIHLSYGDTSRSHYQLDLNKTLEEIEVDLIRIVLEQEGFNQSVAAKRLGINRSTLWRKIK